MEAAKRRRRVASREGCATPGATPSLTDDAAQDVSVLDVEDEEFSLETATPVEDLEEEVEDARSASAGAQTGPDSFFHCEPGLAMTYRLLVGRGKMVADSHSRASLLQQAEAAQRSTTKIEGPRQQQQQQQHSSSSEEDASSDIEARFLVVAFPDVFQTLDTLQAALEPWLAHLEGRGDALLVGFPGAPHTVWPVSTVID